MADSDATTPTDSIVDLLAGWETLPQQDLEALLCGVVGIDRLASLTTQVAAASVDEWADLVPTIVDLIAQQEGVEPWDLEPQLNAVINTDALEAIFVCSAPGESYDGLLTFPYHDYTVKVASDGVVSLHQRGI